MPNPRRKGKDEFWVGVIVAGVIVYSLLASWWKEHVILGSIILSVLLVVAGYVLYKYASLRGWLGHQVKDTIQKTVFENVASEREPLSPYERNAVLKRSHNRCEHELCHFQGKPQIHHIDMNNQNNDLSNLIALCTNCHNKAHAGIFTQSQLFNWARRDYKMLQATRPQDNWRRAAIPNPTITGYCIRCKTEIALDPMTPYCSKCYASWKKYANDEYEDKFCHVCGKPNNSSLKKPACYDCYKIKKDVLKFPSQ